MSQANSRRPERTKTNRDILAALQDRASDQLLPSDTQLPRSDATLSTDGGIIDKMSQSANAAAGALTGPYLVLLLGATFLAGALFGELLVGRQCDGPAAVAAPPAAPPPTSPPNLLSQLIPDF
jgi:hypothetical protein